MADSAVSPVRPESPSDLDVLTSMNLAFDLSPVAMILVDDALRIVKANLAAHQMLAADPLIGRSATEFSVAENVARADGENRSWLSGELTHLERETDLVGRDRRNIAGRRPRWMPSCCRPDADISWHSSGTSPRNAGRNANSPPARRNTGSWRKTSPTPP